MYPRLGVNEKPLEGGVRFGLSKEPWWSAVCPIYIHNLGHPGSNVEMVEAVVVVIQIPRYKAAWCHVTDELLEYLCQKMGN